MPCASPTHLSIKQHGCPKRAHLSTHLDGSLTSWHVSLIHCMKDLVFQRDRSTDAASNVQRRCASELKLMHSYSCGGQTGFLRCCQDGYHLRWVRKHEGVQDCSTYDLFGALHVQPVDVATCVCRRRNVQLRCSVCFPSGHPVSSSQSLRLHKGGYYLLASCS